MELLWHQTQAPQLQQLLLFLRAPLLLCPQSPWICLMLFYLSFLCLPQFLYTVFHYVELPRASMDQCNNTFLFFLSLTLFLILCCFFFPNRQPACSPGKVSLTPQRKPPSSMMITPTTRRQISAKEACEVETWKTSEGGTDRPSLQRSNTQTHTQHSHINKQQE